MKVAVIGGGAAGLVSAKHVLNEGLECDIFESSEQTGGTWVYQESHLGKHGRPVTSGMYKNLRSNLPKELMEFEGLHYPMDDISYIPASLVLRYLHQYTEKYHLKKYIKFDHLVVQVSPFGKKWELKAVNLNSRNNNIETYYYDSVFVCNGHYSVSFIPIIEGSETFPGLSLHSHKYRTPDIFSNKVVLVIGMGPSAQDIVFDIFSTSKQIYLSHHGPDNIKKMFSEKIIHKPDVKRIENNCILFTDGTKCAADAILYCTGYLYNFPFLNKTSGITVEDNYVQPLYKQLISIPHPTMAFIGLPFRSFIFPLLECQVKCFINILMGRAKLPSNEELLNETACSEDELKLRGYPKKNYHMISEYVREYFEEITLLGNLQPLPQVLFKIFERNQEERKKDLREYRRNVFRVLDSNTYSLTKSTLV